MSTAQLEAIDGVRVPISMDAIREFCHKWNVTEFAFFGSVLRDDFRPDSDIDVLITFSPNAHPTLITLARMGIELEAIFGRKVDLLERGGFEQCRNPYIKRPVERSLRTIYAR